MNGRPRRTGFTLVELIVVMGVIVFLLGITFTLIAAVGEQAGRNRTQVTLTLLDQAMGEWETESQRSLTWWNPGDQTIKEQFEIQGDMYEPLIITAMLDIVLRVPTVKSIFGSVDPDLVHTYQAGVYPVWIEDNPWFQMQHDGFDGSLTVLDAWGWPIYATHPGRKWREEDYDPDPWAHNLPRDDDGTIQTYNEQRYGVCRNRQVCFVSAGPDGDFGYLNYPPDSDQYAATQDNLYSYDIDPPVMPEW